MRRFLLFLIVALPLSLAALRPALGDVFQLAGGGKVEGELRNPEEKPRSKYVVALAAGGEVTLLAAQVEKHVPVSAEEQEYEKMRRRAPDTPEGQWAMAEWCRERKMFSERDAHLERTIELDPKHADARRLLGYSQVEGKWVKQEDVMTERGYVRYKGRWRTPQEVELMESKRKMELAEKEWFQKIDRWRSWLGTDRAAQARQNILDINDPAAGRSLVQMLRRDTSPAARILYIEALAKIGGGAAIQAIAVSALEDEESEVRLTCLDQLKKNRNPEAVAYFVTQLRSKSNPMINRAAAALKQMKDPSTIGPLIDALVTVHKFKVSSGQDGQMSSTFGSGGGGGFSFGNSTKILSKEYTNPEVLDALVTITDGQNFNYDKRAWKHWLQIQKRRE